MVLVWVVSVIGGRYSVFGTQLACRSESEGGGSVHSGLKGMGKIPQYTLFLYFH